MSRLRTLTAAVATAVIATAGVSVATAGPPTTPNTASADIQPDASYGDPVGSNTAYSTGSVVSYNGITYLCIQGHTSQTGWEPSNVPALWGKV